GAVVRRGVVNGDIDVLGGIETEPVLVADGAASGVGEDTGGAADGVAAVQRSEAVERLAAGSVATGVQGVVVAVEEVLAAEEAFDGRAIGAFVDGGASHFGAVQVRVE